MKNREIYLTDPSKNVLVNCGVATVNDDTTMDAMKALRYELKTFVCEGQYKEGLSHILETYLKNLDNVRQPAVWVSGFFGSGKTHLVKMLCSLWVDTKFDDGATARGITNLPLDIAENLVELSTLGKRHGGLHTVSGTLQSGPEDNVRMSLLGMVLKSVGLPQRYDVAQFVMWLKSLGIEGQVRAIVEEAKHNWSEEVGTFYGSEVIFRALVNVKPQIFPSISVCAQTLNNLFSNNQPNNSDEMVDVINKVLTMGNGKFPLTLVAIDELQRFIDDNPTRTSAVQELVETCCTKINSKLLFIGTGQTSFTGTSNIKQLEGRFPIRVELSDADVDVVVRQVVLAKKPEARALIEKMRQVNSGEIAKHLEGTSIGHREDDTNDFVDDYPILPVRRRFWERCLRVLDQTGTHSQVRNQLSLVHKAVKDNMDMDLGTVVPADYLYCEFSPDMVHSRILPRNVYDKLLSWSQVDSTDDQRLAARACRLVFLLGRLKDHDKESGISATVDTIADLLVEDLSSGSKELRDRLPGLLDTCELLVRIENEYSILTKESAAWNDYFEHYKSSLSNMNHFIEKVRQTWIYNIIKKVIGTIQYTQGESNVHRKVSLEFGAKPTDSAGGNISVLVRNGWDIDKELVLAESRNAGTYSPEVFLFIPKRKPDEILSNLKDFQAAVATLEAKGIKASSDDVIEARRAMETRRDRAIKRVGELLEDAVSSSNVYKGGGEEIQGDHLKEKLVKACDSAVTRLFPQFQVANHRGWSKVYEDVRKGAPDALKAVGHTDEPSKNGVCEAILNFVESESIGRDIKKCFESSPYGWSGDAVDGGLLVLVAAGLVRALDDFGESVEDVRKIDRKSIGKLRFKSESIVINIQMSLEIKHLLHKTIGILNNKTQLAQIDNLLNRMVELIEKTTGLPPLPEPNHPQYIEDIRRMKEKEKLFFVFEKKDVLLKYYNELVDLDNRLEQRLPKWKQLQALKVYASELPEAGPISAQVDEVERRRQLFSEPDPVPQLILGITDILRKELNKLDGQYSARYAEGIKHLGDDANWTSLDDNQRNQLLTKHHLGGTDKPQIEVKTPEDVLNTLDGCGLTAFSDRVVALSSRFDELASEVAKMADPESQPIDVPRRTLRNEAEVEAWLDEMMARLKAAIINGPVRIR